MKNMFENISKPQPQVAKKELPDTFSPEVRKHLDSMDFVRLQDVFSEKIKSLGIDPAENMKGFVQKDAIKNFSSSFFQKMLNPRLFIAGGEYNVFDKDIKISETIFKFVHSDFIAKRSKQWDSPENPEERKRVYIQSMLCHEETHATSFNTCLIEKDSDKIGSGYAKIQNGFASQTIKIDHVVHIKIQKLFLDFNEGVTDTIAQEAFEQYERKDRERACYPKLYKKSRLLVQNILHEIKRQCDLDQEIVWKVLQKGYFSGENLSGDRIERLFKNVLPENFLEGLSSFNETSKKSADRFYGDYFSQLHWTEDDKKRVRRWILAVHHTMPECSLEGRKSIAEEIFTKLKAGEGVRPPAYKIKYFLEHYPFQENYGEKLSIPADQLPKNGDYVRSAKQSGRLIWCDGDSAIVETNPSVSQKQLNLISFKDILLKEADQKVDENEEQK